MSVRKVRHVRVDGDLIRRGRLACDPPKRQVDVADEAGISQPHLVAIERGYREPSISVLVAICRAVGLPVDAVLVPVDDEPEAVAK